VKSRPILFSAPLIPPLVDGRKTQTRRLVLGAPDNAIQAVPSLLAHGGDLWDFRPNLDNPKAIRCPYGAPGDRLWVREEHYRYGHWEKVTGQQRRTRTGRQRWRFVADTSEVLFDAPAAFRKGRHHRDPATPAWHKRLARFMPRAFSRITLEIVEVRVQRLQEISEGDAQAEGVEPYTPPHGHISPEQRVPGPGFDRCRLGDQPHRLPFADLWDSINGKRCPWSSNPWCWCLTFRRLA